MRSSDNEFKTANGKNRIMHLRHLHVFLSTILVVIGMDMAGYAQCNNAHQFPSEPITASPFNDTRVVTEEQEAGQYYVIRGLAVNKTYQFASSAPGDFITVRDRDGITALAFGVSPVSYMVTGDDIVTVHINLSAGCGTETAFRTTTATCVDCPDVPGRFGIAEADPVATLDVQGGVRVGNVTRPAETGMIRWNEDAADFEGYDGTKWRSFTKAQGGWGQVYSPVAYESEKIFDLNPYLYFGWHFDIEGDVMIVGRPSLDLNNQNIMGAAFVFHRENGSWSLADTLFSTSSPGDMNTSFGSEIDIQGDRAILGAWSEDVGGKENQGAAYIFRRSGNTWEEEAKLTAFDGDTSDIFGTGVSLYDEYVVVGAMRDDYPGVEDQGSAYIYKLEGTNWVFDTKITSSQPTETGFYGEQVSIDNDYLIVGARREPAGGATLNGTAYIYERDTISGIWTEVERIVPSLLESFGQSFGASVDLSGNVAVVTNSCTTINDTICAGAVFVFERIGGSWQETQVLSLSDPVSSDFFGSKVEIRDTTILVSAQGRDVDGNEDQGAAYLYQLLDGSWTLKKTLVASDGGVDDLFGIEVGIDQDILAVGAAFHDIGELALGAIWLFQKE